MIDPQTFLDGVFSWNITLDPVVVRSSLITLAVTYGMNRLIQYGQRGKRVGALSGPLEVVRAPSRFQGRWRLLGNGLGLAVIAVFTYLGLDKLGLPFRPWTPGLLTLAAVVRLGFSVKSLKGTCVGYEKGLVIEGGYYAFEKLSLEPEPGGVSLGFGKVRLFLGWAQFERNKGKIRSVALHMKFDTLRQRAVAAPGRAGENQDGSP